MNREKEAVPGIDNDAGGTGLRPVVLGVTPETVVSRPIAPSSSNQFQSTSADEIRRDAGFDGRDARATFLKTRRIPARSRYLDPYWSSF